MNRILAEQNPWWENKNAIESDKHIAEYSRAHVQFPLPDLKAKEGVYILRGPRQVGKTTLLKLLIQNTLKNQTGDSVFYFSAESGYPLENAIREYLDFSPQKRRMICIDEATEDMHWATRLKYLIDTGKISGEDLVIITGSSSIDLKKGAERLPGRYVEGNEYLFYPYSFRDCVPSEIPLLDLAKFDMAAAQKLYLHPEAKTRFLQYIRNGGLPAPWNIDRELARERYARWIEGVLSRHGKSILYSRELLSKLGEKTVFDFAGLAKETSIRSHHTVEDYLSFFEAVLLGKLVYTYSLAIHAPDPKKEKKFVFIDPFFVEMFSSKRDESLVVEDIVGSHLLRVCDEVYFYRDKQMEIDFLCRVGKKLIPVEVKWSSNIRESDASPLRKFGKGFLVTKDTLAVFGDILAVPAFVFLALIGKTLVKRKIL